MAAAEGGEMRRAIVLVLLMLARAAFAGSPPATEFSIRAALSQPGQSDRPIVALPGSPDAVTAPRMISDDRYVYEVWGNTLRRLDRNDAWRPGYAASYSRATTTAPGMPVWKQAGAYTLEFAAAGVGALLAEACGLTTLEGVYQAGWNGPGSVPGAAAYCLASAVLSAGGTHLVGKLFGRANTFNRALAGGAVGGLLGGAAFADYFVTRRNPHTVMLPVGLLLPPLCTVIIYNVWRGDGPK
jgi:hypothetical protein